VSAALPHAFRGTPVVARLRAEPADFRVEEVLGFTPEGEGEHAFLLVEKTGANTEWVGRQLADAAGVAPHAVGYAGLKDRHAVTRQTYTVHLPGRAGPDWLALAIPGVRVLAATRHNRKLKRGAHRGNRFRIRLRDVRGDIDGVDDRLAQIRARGVPNYFGEQRFGRDAQNLALAQALFGGRCLPRAQRGFALSAARAALFNALLARRVVERCWDRALDGEVFMLDGSNALFGPEPSSAELAQRLAARDVHPTGPLWGSGALRSTGAAGALEAEVAAAHAEFARGLEAAGLGQERRATRVCADGFGHAWESGDLVVEFTLRAGAFATTLLRELCDWQAGAA
jgi:tRNA pseudouridine13 synthase